MAVCSSISGANTFAPMSKRRPLTEEEQAEAGRLMALYERKKAMARELGIKLTQEDVASYCGWSGQSAFSQYATGKVALNLDALIRMAKVLEFSPREVSPRLADMIESVMPHKVEANAEMIGMMSPWDGLTPLQADEVAIPLYKEVEMAAGQGATEVIEVPGRLIRFAKSTLRESGVIESNAACATIKGRSMERLIMDGATIGIDKGTTHVEDGEIYAFDHDGMLRVKYLYRLPGGGLRIRSENDEEYPDEFLSSEEAASIRILGWVFWWSTVRRRRGLSLAR
ncbi:transcriptional regulator [Pseudomonas resinovorans]|uniref:Transcriptional regulator n=1 Tax=Metapseudomonas resinovorans TaxID=53412 RepID=A0ABT4Y8D6_METRE|nr:S24 family peptidase [Pseudomonas resinovorans]MDA8485133.1 transcriptional regulator [Pseudomonas resinovorans]